MEPRPLPGTEILLAPLGLARPGAVRDPVVESRLAKNFAEAVPATPGRLLVDLGESTAAALREPLWAVSVEDSASAPVLLTHESHVRTAPASPTAGSLRLRSYPWRSVRAAPPSTPPSTVWGVDLSERELDPELLTEVAGRDPGFVTLPIHLLDAAAVLPGVDRLAKAGVAVIGTDPFAGGRLDGSFLGQSPLEHDPRARPLDAKEVRGRFAPVLSLGFLTTDTGRSLPEAALEFAGSVPGVITTLAPFRTPRDLRNAIDGWGRRPLTAAERTRLSTV